MKPNAFKRRREELELTQRQVAEAFNPPLAGATVGTWENGIATPRRTMLAEIARVYRQSEEWAAEAMATARRQFKRARKAGKGELVKA
jgi:transcriptional regulator with XRE-family HTH domain